MFLLCAYHIFMVEKLEEHARKGRGAISNASGRYELEQRARVDDGWRRPEQADPDRGPEAPALDTVVIADSSRTILAKNDSPDIPFDRSINPYRGCEHGCIYCFARPSHAWLGFSPGLDFETRILAKHGAADLLREALGKRGYKPAVIALGANTDPYQPIERRLGITRQVLEVLAEARHPACLITKSHLVTRDLDLLSDLARDRLVRVILSVTTLSPELARTMEPRASTPKRRLQAITRLASAGVPVGVLSAPMIPAINDHEMEAILEASAGAGAVTAGYTLLRLPLEIKQLFEEWLDAHFPDRKDKVLNLVRETRGGKLYDPTFGRRLKGSGTYAELLSSRFKQACKRCGLNSADWELSTESFRPPRADQRQLTLF